MKIKQTQKNSSTSIIKKGTALVLGLAFMSSMASENIPTNATSASKANGVFTAKLAKHTKIDGKENYTNNWNNFLNIKVKDTSATTSAYSTYPSEILGVNTNTWKVNSFIGAPGPSAKYVDDMSQEVPDITKYSDEHYFYASGDYAVFHAYSGMATSANSHNSRVELREMTTGGESASWDGSTGTHTMTWTVNVAQLNKCDVIHRTNKDNVLYTGSDFGKVTVGQVHGPKTNKDGVKVDDIIRVQILGRANATSGSGYLVIGGYIAENFIGNGKDYTVPGFNFKLNTDYTFTIKYAGGTVYLYNDSTLLYSQRMDTSCESNYFKAGCYLQGTNGKSGEGIYDFDGTGGIVKIKDLKVTHN